MIEIPNVAPFATDQSQKHVIANQDHKHKDESQPTAESLNEAKNSCSVGKPGKLVVIWCPEKFRFYLYGKIINFY